MTRIKKNVKSSVKQSSALPSQQYRVTNKHKTYYAEQWFQLGNNSGYRHQGRSSEVRPRIYLFWAHELA